MKRLSTRERRHTAIGIGLGILSALLAAASASGKTIDVDAGETGWTGEAAMISNVGVYRDGEFIYQDYVYDDHGPNTDGLDRTDLPFGIWPDPEDPTDPDWSPTGGQTRYAGDFMYASADGEHFQNVADLIELRVTADESDVFYMIRLGALVNPDDAVVGICVDEDRENTTGLSTWPLGANLTGRLGCEHLYTVFGTGGFVTDGDGDTTSLADAGGAVQADTIANVMNVRIPRTVADPGTETWRIVAASGVWDSDAGTWLDVPPGPQVAGAPIATGGGTGTHPNLWDLLSNNDEPNSYWLEEKQANDLAEGQILEHFVDVDFARIADSVANPDPAPRIPGFQSRIYVSDFELDPKEGIGIDGDDFVYYGRYQPYAMVVPSAYYDAVAADPETTFAFDLCMHPLNGNHMVEVYYAEAFARENYTPGVSGVIPQTGYFGFAAIENLVDRLGTLYACVLGRGEGVGYTGGIGLVDVQEVAADVEENFRVDPDRRTAHGVSLGAIGTWYVARLFPDRFSAVMPYIFTSGIVPDTSLLENLQNLPVFYAIGTLDQFGQGILGDQMADRLDELGNEYVYLHYLGRQHEGRIEEDFLPFTEALAYTRERVENPARVRYVFEPDRFNDRLPGDGAAYWVSGMELAEGASQAEIDVTSFGRADELPTDRTIFDGIYANLREGYLARIRGLFRVTPEAFGELWTPAVWEDGWQEITLDLTHETVPAEAVRNAIDLASSDLAAVTLDLERMKIDGTGRIDGTVSGNGDLTLTLLGDIPAGTTVTLDGDPVAVDELVPGTQLVVTLPLTGGDQVLVID